MKNRYTHWRSLTILILIMIGVSSCTDDLAGLEINSTRPSDVICFSASLSNTRSASQTRSASGHLEIEQEEWLVGTEQSVTRGTPVTLLEGSAGVIGYVYDTWSNSEKPWESLYKKEYAFDGDELTAVSSHVRWNTLDGDNARFYVYAPYNLSGGALSGSSQEGAPKLTYNVDGTPANQHDLIVASWEGSTSYKKSIPLSFEHALTAIKFKVGFDCKVTKLEVKGIYNSGTYTFGKGWEVNTTSNYKFTFGDKIPNTDDDYTGIDFTANAFLTDGNNTLMMIPQTLSSSAKVILTYIEGGTEKTITSTLKDKVWQEGKMITYTIHKDEAPTIIYFDLAAGNVEICSGTTIGPNGETLGKVTGYIFEKGNDTPQLKTYQHDDSYVYHVYQSTDLKRNPSSTNIKPTGVLDGETIILPVYDPVTYQGQTWGDYITNNQSVEDVIEIWDNGKNIRDDAKDAPGEKHLDVAVVRNVGRTHTKNYIKVIGENAKYNLTIDNIYSVAQTKVRSNNNFRGRNLGGISYMPQGGTELRVNLVGDNRMGCLHIDNTETDKIIIEGTGSLTTADADFDTVKDIDDASGLDIGDTENGYVSNHWAAVIGGNTLNANTENVFNIYINSGIIFAGAAMAEDCTAIGGGGNGSGQVFISGGVVTAVARTAGTAIGGGMGHNANGGPGYVHISGGNVYAFNFANRWAIPSSAIGGGSSANSTGSIGKVTIDGGYVYAYSALGTAIGGGSSKTLIGGNANITISGGQVIAKSGQGAGIGGGSSRTGGGNVVGNSYNGGTATINISGNPIIRTGSIGGGITGDPTGKLGYAKINVSGGDIQAQFVMEAGSTGTPTFEMSGGTIRNSYVNDTEYIHTKKFGGAVYLEDGTFTMSGGTIKNCSAVQGGAVYIARKSEEQMAEDQFNFKMEGGEIHSCFATGGEIGDTPYLGHGGAICLDGGQIHMSGGKIWNNYSENGNGGAVYISNGNFFMKNLSRIITHNYPTITGNAAHKGNGGGVFVSSENGKSVMVDLLQGIITNNTANNYGGGICVDMGNTENEANVTVGADGQGVTESNANPKISGNMAMMSGGGLYVRGTNANVTINSGMISKNKVSAYVKNQDVANEMGGVTLNDGLVTHVEVTFNGNGGKDSGTETYFQKIVTNTNSKLTRNRFIRAGYDFKCWNTRADGLGDSYSEGDAKPHSSDITLYAQWEAQ